ncbi:hypothetical protein F4809DRAFT_629426 [Biscogniauxia mediterranea]|nr:hypothetical protein F4809DRAFT_629426 [Biscogniauxia mediterranea]
MYLLQNEKKKVRLQGVFFFSPSLYAFEILNIVFHHDLGIITATYSHPFSFSQTNKFAISLFLSVCLLIFLVFTVWLCT